MQGPILHIKRFGTPTSIWNSVVAGIKCRSFYEKTYAEQLPDCPAVVRIDGGA